jgi:hypothetical protein
MLLRYLEKIWSSSFKFSVYIKVSGEFIQNITSSVPNRNPDSADVQGTLDCGFITAFSD